MSPFANISELLHDATLELITVDWINLEVQISVRLSSEEAHLATYSLRGFTDIKMSRLEPWGSSLSVNLARVTHSVQGAVQVWLQLQSGDVLTVEAQSIELLQTAKSL